MRPGVHVRSACPHDLEDLVDLCLAARSEAGVGSQLCTEDSERLRSQLGTLLATPGGEVLIGTVDDQAAGLLLARIVGPGPFTDQSSLHLEALFVLPDARRRGLGHALLSRAVQLAEQAGATELYSSPLPGARGMQRFLARLGFAPAAAHRVVTTAVLQRRLTHEVGPASITPSVRRTGPRGLEDLIARRRQVREGRRLDEASAADAAAQARASINMQVSRAVQSCRPSSSSTTTW
ncbi:GNAT family N-acetyltransferase [Cellulomonas sp.]|uniref:GNAT family N-acetyltransferase n=1 Tax=Cellulomonas sp. TaxID=40001 RepID=UPI001B130135|nr:GNAT family N-acetyltransferase [Cellulomonas sp.]MBO9554478.1 GNAT family N-acetyltransferase [Cellulomonas sp.]